MLRITFKFHALDSNDSPIPGSTVTVSEPDDDRAFADIYDAAEERAEEKIRARLGRYPTGAIVEA